MIDRRWRECKKMNVGYGWIWPKIHCPTGTNPCLAHWIRTFGEMINVFALINLVVRVHGHQTIFHTAPDNWRKRIPLDRHPGWIQILNSTHPNIFLFCPAFCVTVFRAVHQLVRRQSQSRPCARKTQLTTNFQATHPDQPREPRMCFRNFPTCCRGGYSGTTISQTCRQAGHHITCRLWACGGVGVPNKALTGTLGCSDSVYVRSPARTLFQAHWGSKPGTPWARASKPSCNAKSFTTIGPSTSSESKKFLVLEGPPGNGFWTRTRYLFFNCHGRGRVHVLPVGDAIGTSLRLLLETTTLYLPPLP